MVVASQFGHYCRMIKIEHSIFALPYAYAGAFLAARALPPLHTLAILTVAMVAVRSYAMGFNRLADVDIDRANPRTQGRPLVTGAIGIPQARLFTALMALLFIIACAFLNRTCLMLSAPALVFAGIYSFLKRITPICHFWLGATLGLAPLAGALAVNGNILDLGPILLCLAVTCWVGAFDIYYAFQDLDVDRHAGLHSIPADFGPETAMALAAFSHVMTIVFLLLTGLAAPLGWPWYALCAGVAILLFFEHRLVNPDDLRHVNTAFFTLNGIISPLVLLGVVLGIYF